MNKVIRNRAELCTSRAASDALDIIEAGYEAASPKKSVEAHITDNELVLRSRRIELGSYRRVCLIAYGKAAAAMAQTVERNAEISDGIIVIPEEQPRPKLGSKYTVLKSSHPYPSSKSVAAALAIRSCISTLEKNDFVLFLVSGGGSSMLALPHNISLAEKVRANKLLIKSNASIAEINCVRRHLSKIKGGKLVANLPCKGAALLMSDVQGDMPYNIASGCTQKDSSTPADALDIIKKYRLRAQMPKRVITSLKSAGPGLQTGRIPNIVIASNNNCICAMIKKARGLGYRITKESAYGSLDDVVDRITARRGRRPMSCIIFGGEPTLRVRGRGRGGRNQELVARALRRIMEPGIIVASVGTDGIDGNSDAAGALAESAIISRSEIARYLRDNNSNALFARHTGLIKTGHTGTNLQDIGVLVRRE